MKLLIVEDEIDIAELMAEVLSEDVQEILTAEDGLQALEKMKQHPDIDCVITDINMPHMDGITLCQKLQITSPGTLVLMVTAEAAYEKKARTAGAIGVLFKPFGMEEFRSWVLEKVTFRHTINKN